MTTTTTLCVLLLLTLGWTGVSVLQAQQNVGCGSLKSQLAVDNLRNVSVGMSNQVLRQFALRPLLAQPRVSGTEGNLRARSFIKKWMTEAGGGGAWTVEEDPFWADTPSHGRRQFSNVVATLYPGRPRRVVLACHYDSKMMPPGSAAGGQFFFFPFFGTPSPPSPAMSQAFVGATDSAVPCALLLDSAWQLGKLLAAGDKAVGGGAASNYSLQLIFFDGEEAFGRWSRQDSLYGARHLAQKWATTPDPASPGMSYLQTIEVLILLDLIGTADTHFKNRFIKTTGVFQKLQNIELCLKKNGYLRATANPAPLFSSTPEFSLIEDDHLPFLQRGVPVVHLITSPFPWVWHTPMDNEDNLDFQRIDNLARVLRVFLLDLFSPF